MSCIWRARVCGGHIRSGTPTFLNTPGCVHLKVRVRGHAMHQFRYQPNFDTPGCVHFKCLVRNTLLQLPFSRHTRVCLSRDSHTFAPGVRECLCFSTTVQYFSLKTRVRTPRGRPQLHGALPTETKAESGTSQSKSGTSVQLSEGGVCGGHTRSGAPPFPRHTRVRPSIRYSTHGSEVPYPNRYIQSGLSNVTFPK